MKLAWRRKTGFVSEVDLPDGRVLRGAMIDSSNMLKGKVARLRASIVGMEWSCLRSFTTRRGNLAKGSILKTPELPGPEPWLTIWPAIHGKLAESLWRPLISVWMIVDCDEASVQEEQEHI